MIQNGLRSIVFFFVFCGAVFGQERETLIQSVNSIPGWVATGSSADYNESNIDEFAPKLASNLRAYGINGVREQAWHGPYGTVRAELFQFHAASDAYGYFTVLRRSERASSSDSPAGTESFKTGNRLHFWQASYVVQLEGDSRATEAIAKVLSEKIVGRSQRPPLESHLPTTNLVAGSETYILDETNVPTIEGVSPSSFGFESSAEAAFADYRVNGKTAHLLLLLYPTQQIAKKYSDQINASAPQLTSSQKRIGPLLAIVTGASDDSSVHSILDQVHYSSKVTWNEPQPGLGLGPIIVTVFTFIGILLGLCVIVGFGLGGMRVLMKIRYPNRAFGRPEGTEIIQLKLDQGLTRKHLSD